jgi:hypothetical protein
MPGIHQFSRDQALAMDAKALRFAIYSTSQMLLQWVRAKDEFTVT